MIGTKIGPYEIIQELGRGGMATVYRAYHPGMDRFVAIKIIHRALATDKAGVERFRREARLIARLEHPHLLPVYDYAPDHDPPYIVMRYLEGGTLKDVLDEKRLLPLGEVAHLMRQIASAMDYAHRQGVVHRDIKPSNIMVDQDGNAFVADFGIARINDGLGMTQTGFTVGTPGYMSPEQGMGLSTIDLRADIYSLGVMVFEMATGRAPYTGETPMAVLFQHIQNPVPSALQFNPNLPEDIDQIFHKALAKQPEERYSSAGQLSEVLVAMASNSAANARPVQLQTAAMQAIQTKQKERSSTGPDEKTMLEKFEAMREQPTTPGFGVPITDGPTSNTPIPLSSLTPNPISAPLPTVEQAAPVAPRRPTGLIIGGTAAVIVAAIALFLLRPKDTGGNVTLTAPVTVGTQLVGNTTPNAATLTFSAQSLVVTAEVTQEATTTKTIAQKPSPTATRQAGKTPSAVVTDSLMVGPDSETNTPTAKPGTATPTPKPPTSTHTPTITTTPSAPVTPSLTATASATITLTPLPPTPATPIMSARRAMDIRVGPGPGYPVIAQLNTGDQLETLGISADGRWLKVLLLDGAEGWVLFSSASAELLGNQQVLVVAQAPTFTPTDTPTNTPTATTTPTATSTPSATPTSSPTNTPTYTPSPTNTATYTPTPLPPSLTPSETPSPTQTFTATPTASFTPSETPSETPSPTQTFTATPTASFTPSETPSATPSSTPTPTSTETPTATPTITVTPPPTFTPTLQPVGILPYVQNFEAPDALLGSDFDNTAWQLVNEGGQNILTGRARLIQPFILLGSNVPEWLTTPDFVINFRAYLEAAEGLRVVFRYQQNVGYEVVEITPGTVFLKRNSPNAPNPLTDRAKELRVKQGPARLKLKEWHNYTIWASQRRIFVYMDNMLIVNAEDTNQPELGAGLILLQINNAFKSTRIDDVVIQRPEPGTEAFEAGVLPSTWTSKGEGVTIGADPDNQYLRIKGPSEAAPQLPAIEDFELRCRLWNEVGGHQLYLRASAGGVIRFNFAQGSLTLDYLDGTGNPVWTRPVPNIYSRNRWQDFQVFLVGNRLEIYANGEKRFAETFDATPGAGGIRFAALVDTDIFRVDDCLITRSTVDRGTNADFAFEIQDQVLARTFRYLRSDLDENFDEKFRTDEWWVNGLKADGEFVTDPASSTHGAYLQMKYQDRPTWRLFRDVIGVEMFGKGQDTTTYDDSTDLYITLDLRLQQPGTAWLNFRTTLSPAGSDLQGYRMGLRRDAQGQMTLLIEYQSSTEKTTIYEGPVPGADQGPLPEWIPLRVLTYKEKMAFFANDKFITFVEKADKFGGTLALSVEPGTTADFDALIIRDTTPHGQ